MSYLDSVKENFKKFTDYLYSSDLKDKYIREQEFLDTEIRKISSSIIDNYTKDKHDAYDYLVLQKNYSNFVYL